MKKIVIRPRPNIRNRLTQEEVESMVRRQLGRYLTKLGKQEYPLSLQELVRLAKQESGFDPRAESNKGAAGLFQFLPSTAIGVARQLKKLGLINVDPKEIDAEWLKQHPEESALFAIHYLDTIYQRMKNRFPLQQARAATLLGYLAGPNNTRYIQKWINKSHPYVVAILEPSGSPIRIRPQLVEVPSTPQISIPHIETVPQPASDLTNPILAAAFGPIWEHIQSLLALNQRTG
jgi:hypothetical protein